jgi:hypothetical protein
MNLKESPIWLQVTIILAIILIVCLVPLVIAALFVYLGMPILGHIIASILWVVGFYFIFDKTTGWV